MQQITPALTHWLAQQLNTTAYEIAPLKGDASFRTYFRVKISNKTYILMVAPPEKERTDAFVAIAQGWQQRGLNVPEILGWEPQQGFVLLSDFGDTLLLQELSAQTVDGFYQEAMEILLKLQHCQAHEYTLPAFDANYLRLELSYFKEWFLQKLLQLPVDDQADLMLDQLFSALIRECISQPKVTVHRDYHSRNLMVLPQGKLGIIDFQDAMMGHISYDLVSLLRDCYVSWPLAQVHQWVGQFQERLTVEKQLAPMAQQVFLQWFDWAGLQRHLKVLGIFSRLKIRDHKPQYLLDIPRILNYVLQVSGQYPVFVPFYDWLHAVVIPQLQQVWEQQNIDSTFKVA